VDTATEISTGSSTVGRPKVSRIAVGVDGFPEGEDAAALGAALARATAADLLLVTVHSEPLILPPIGVNWTSLREEARAMLHKVRSSLAPGARTTVETDFSVPRALHRVVHGRQHDLLVMGSSRHAPEGQVRIGKRTRQLLCHFECPLAVAPRGYRHRESPAFERIGVGYDGGAESQAALGLAAFIATTAGAKLEAYMVVDDRLTSLAWATQPRAEAEQARLEEAVGAESDKRREEAEVALKATGASGRAHARRGRPADALLELSKDVDLLVIGSRRWGPMTRVLLGSTGEALLHDAAAPVLVVPRPAE
jgi:nucleotide-binding universal stress UspA family protein